MKDNRKFVIVVPITSSGEIIFYQGKRGWELPGGSIEPGETPKKAAIRELFEECGIKLNLEDLIFVGTLRSKDGEGYIYAVLIDKNVSLSNNARVFKEMPKKDLAYPLYETLSIINAAKAIIEERIVNDKSSGFKNTRNSKENYKRV